MRLKLRSKILRGKLIPKPHYKNSLKNGRSNGDKFYMIPTKVCEQS